MLQGNLGPVINQVSTSAHQLKRDYTHTRDLTSKRTQKPLFLDPVTVDSPLPGPSQPPVSSAEQWGFISETSPTGVSREAGTQCHIPSSCKQMEVCLLAAWGQRSLPLSHSNLNTGTFLLAAALNTESKMALNANHRKKEADNITITFIYKHNTH